jgi:hypothetical protein
MRTTRSAIVLVVVLLVLAVLACGEEARPIPLSVTAAQAPPRPSAAPAAASSAPADDAQKLIEILGEVVDEVGDPVVGREVAIADARGRRWTALSDEGGTFWVSGVAPPYDVRVAETPSRANAAPVAYLGLRRKDPRFVVLEHDGPPPRAPSQLVRVTLNVPPCAAPACWVSVATSSPSGAGQAGRTIGAGDRLVVVDVDHAWSASAVPEGEVLEVHAVAGDEGYSELSYARAGAVPARAGEVVDVGLMLARVETTAPVTITAQGRSVPADWEWTVATRLRLSENAALDLHYVRGPALVTRLPRIAGATLEAGAWAQRPRHGDDPFVHRSAFVWSGPVALGAAQVLLDLPAGLELVRPGPHGRLSRRGAGIAWSGPAPGLVVVDLGTAGGRPVLRAFTSGGGVPFARLTRLGLALPDPGDHLLDVTSYADTTLDDAVDPTQRRAPSTIGRTRGGTVAYQRVRFQVVP